MHERILRYANILLILICAVCIWRLATWKYEKPAEIVAMQKELDSGADPTAISSGPADPANTGAMPPKHPTLIQKASFQPFYTPTPTPTPTPVPPPPPPPLVKLIYTWKLVGLHKDSAEFQDTRRNAQNQMEIFELKVGQSRDAPWTDGKRYPVKLEQIDIYQAQVVVSFGRQTHTIGLK